MPIRPLDGADRGPHRARRTSRTERPDAVRARGRRGRRRRHRSGSATRRHACSPRSTGSSSRSSRSTPTTAPPTTIADERPACGVRWWGIAGISRVEGRHGTYGGTTLEPNGDTTRRIIGIQLNGANETAVVGDSDGGTLDGDPAYDRAVGPMQFIPQTWSRLRGRRQRGRHHARRSTCTTPRSPPPTTSAPSSSGLDADPGLRTAYFSYNHSVAYVDAVLGYARLYERQGRRPRAAGPGPRVTRRVKKSRLQGC